MRLRIRILWLTFAMFAAGTAVTSLLILLPQTNGEYVSGSVRAAWDITNSPDALLVSRNQRTGAHGFGAVRTSMMANTHVISAYQHLTEVMDKYHHTFDVYSDVGAGGNHFVHRAMAGSDVTINDAYTQVVRSGASAIRNTFSPTQSADWGGWFFQNGVLITGIQRPQDNWGTYPNAGYDLSDATALSFWARGDQGGERVEFFVFGIAGPYGDSAPKTTLCGPGISPCYITLTNTWQLYTIPLTGLDLSYIIGGFGWVTNATQNNNQSIIFYLDDIWYDKPHLNALRLPMSYETISSTLGFDTQQRNVAFTYDSVLALSAFITMRDWERAGLLADALVYAQQHDRYYTDSRLRNAYQSGDLTLPPGWNPNAAARLPGWWDASASQWFEDAEQVGTATGNLAWAMIGLLNYYEAKGGSQYLTTTIDIGNWIHANTYSGNGGYIGGYQGPDTAPVTQTWKSTEHNLDLYAAFERLYRITGQMTWHNRALHAKAFVDDMWNPDGGHFWTGTCADGTTINETVIPLDAQTWSLLAMGESYTTTAAIHFAEISHTTAYSDVQGYDFRGFDFNEDQDVPWPEGTAQMVVVYWLLGETSKAQEYLSELRELQVKAVNANDRGIVASPSYSLTTGFDWMYYNRLHVGATAWYIFAERKYNPFYGTFHTEVYLPLILRQPS